MRKSTHNSVQSRRTVQRRFEPGSFIIDEMGRMGLVIGWAPVAPTVSEHTGKTIIAQSWEALIIHGESHLQRRRWESIRNNYTFEEWMAM